MFYLLVIAAAAAAAVILLAGKRGPRRGPLRERCIQELRLPPREAEKTLERHLEYLRQKHPGRDEEWYLEKILYDLGRDRM